jgi:hypothetical protein
MTTRGRARKAPDYAAQDAKNRELGSAGELLVLEHERQTLLAQGRGDLAAKVRHVSAIEGEGPGYDIESFTADGTAKYIDVKTTSGSAATGFFLTPREVQFSQDRAENYYLYRVYEYDHSCNSAKVYILRGDLRAGLELAPTAYRAMLLSSG